MDQPQYTSLLAALKAVPDYRQARGQRYPWEFLWAAVCGALLSGHRTGSAIAEWVMEHTPEVAAWLRLPLRRAPSHSTVRRALRYVDVDALERAIAAFVQGVDATDEGAGVVVGADGQPLRGQAVDGKAVRGAGAHGVKVHLLSLVRHGSGDTLAQGEVGEKTNEIPGVTALLAGRDLRGTVLTLDALHTQRATAERILDQGGDYLMVVKKNQPQLYADLDAYFRDLPPEDARDTYRSVGKAHGRWERRTLTCSPGLNGYLDWPGARQVARRRCQRVVIRSGATHDEVTYAVTSLGQTRAGARQLEALWRAHWTIENRSHYVRDETLGEDRCQIHRGSAPRALAALRNGLLAAVRHAGWTNIAQALRYYAAAVGRALGLLAGPVGPEGPGRAPQAGPAPR